MDNIKVTWTELIDAVGAFDAGNHVLTDGAVLTFGAPTGTDDPADVSNILNVSVPGVADVTGDATAPQYEYNNVASNDYIQDVNGNIAVTHGAYDMVDGAGPVALDADYLDTEPDGVIDRIDIFTTADTGLTCTYEVGDWTIDTPGTVNVTLTGASCSTGTNVFQLTVSADANITGGAIDPVVSYADLGTLNNVTDGASNDAVIISQTANDMAAPLVLTQDSAAGDFDVPVGEDINLTFTEQVDSTPGNFTVTIIPDPVSVGVMPPPIILVWSAGDTALLVDHTRDYEFATTYTATIAGTDVSTATNALSAGIKPIVWRFSTGTRRYIDSGTGGGGGGGGGGSSPAPTTDDDEEANEDEDEEVPIEIEEELAIAGPFGNDIEGNPIMLGSLVKMAGVDAVYYVDQNGVRHVFMSLWIYQTWYGDDFSSVVEVSAETMATLRLGSPVTFRPGTMIKITTIPDVFLVVGNRIIRHIVSEDIAQELFGDNWNQNIYDVPDSLFFAYVEQDTITSADEVDIDELLSDYSITINTEVIAGAL